jgi:hypothetical protein
MTADVYSLEEALEDSAALVDIASAAGIPTGAAKKVAAGLASLPIRQAIRICVAALRQETIRKRRTR